MSLSKTIEPIYKPSKMQANQLVRDWRLNKKPVAGTALLSGNIIFTNYVAVTPGVYDYNPVVLILRANKFHIFGINVNWVELPFRKKMMRFMIERNMHNNTRLQNIAFFKQLKKFPFTRKAYRLYHRKEFAKPRIFKLDAYDLYDAMMHNMLTKKKVKRRTI